MRRSIVTVGAVVLGLVAFTPGGRGRGARNGRTGRRCRRRAGGAKPAGPNPFLALRPNASKVDYAGMDEVHATEATAKAAERLKALTAAKSPALKVAARRAGRDRRGRAGRHVRRQRHPGHRAAGQRVRHRGEPRRQDQDPRQPGQRDRRHTEIPAAPEDNGAIPLAGDTGIGDVPQRRDHDHRDDRRRPARRRRRRHRRLRLLPGDRDRRAGARACRPTPRPARSTRSCAVRRGRHARGTNDDCSGLDSLLDYTVPASGDVLRWPSPAYSVLPADPFDSGSGARRRPARARTRSTHRARRPGPGLLRGRAARRRRARRLGEGLARPT